MTHVAYTHNLKLDKNYSWTSTGRKNVLKRNLLENNFLSKGGILKEP